MSDESPGSESETHPSGRQADAAGSERDAYRCPECDGETIPGSDECQHCGAAIDSGEGRSLEVWSWAGGIIAGFGIFITPFLAGPPALYCAWKIKEWKPQSARYIVYAVAGTAVFWLFFYPLLYISATS